MRHSYFGKKLSRDTQERRRLLRNLMKSMILHGAIKTTKAKAQAVRSELERLITKSKKNTEPARRDLISRLTDRTIVSKLIEMSQTRFAGRQSGYTRIVKLGLRAGDAAQEVLLSFVDEEVQQEVVKPKDNSKKEEVKSEPKTEKKPARVQRKKKE